MTVDEHRYQQTDRPVLGRAMNRPQLLQEHIGLGEAVADCPLAERRVGSHRLIMAFVIAAQGLVSTDVDGSDRDQAAPHRNDRGGISLVLLVFARSVVAIHEHEFGAKQTDAVGTRLHRLLGLGRQLDVGMQLDRNTVNGRRGHMHQPLELLALEQAQHHAVPVLLEHDGVGRNHQHARVAVEHHPVIVTDQQTAGVQPDHRRHIHAARQNRGVRGGAAEVDREATGLLQMQHVGRRNIMGNENQRHVARLGPLGQTAARSGKCLEHPIGDLRQITTALAQIGIFELFKLRRQVFDLRKKRPLCVLAMHLDRQSRLLDQRWVFEHHRVDLQQSLSLGWRVDRQLLGKIGELEPHHVDRAVEPAEFGGTLLGRDAISRHIDQPRFEHDRTADDDAAADAGAVQAEHGACGAGLSARADRPGSRPRRIPSRPGRGAPRAPPPHRGRRHR